MRKSVSLRTILLGTVVGLVALMPDVASAQASSDGIEQVTVTAERRSEQIQHVAASIQAFNADTLTQNNINDFGDLQRLVSGLTISASGPAPSPSIRGIGGHGNNPGDEPVVATYIDGVYQPFARAGYTELNNVERVEVLKGPQGTLYGRNATGGAILIVTRDPTVDPSAQFSASYGSYGERRESAYMTGGFGKIAADVAIEGNDDNGYDYDPIRKEHTGRDDSFNIRSKVQFTPNDNAKFTLIYSHLYDANSEATAVQPVDGNTIARVKAPLGLFIPTQPYQVNLTGFPTMKNAQDSLAFVANFHFDAFDLNSVSNAQGNWAHFIYDSDGVAPNVITSDTVDKSRTLDEELYATSNNSGPFQWVVGSFYYHDTSKADPQIVAGQPFVYTRGITDSIAAYAQGTYNFTKDLALTVGGRYTNEHRTYDATQAAASAHGHVRYGRLTPSATLEYHESDDWLFYAKADQAFKSGIFNSLTLNAVPARPESVTGYEAGVKADPATWLRTNVALFYNDYKNMQVNAKDPVTGVSTLINAASATTYGVDADITVVPTEGLNLTGGVTIMHATYSNFPGAQFFVPTGLGGNTLVFGNAKGNQIQRIPRYQGNLGADYTMAAFGGNLNFTANALFVGKMPWNLNNHVEENPYTVLDAQISWTPPSGHYRLSVWGRNLGDSVYRIDEVTSTNADTQGFAPPRFVGIKAEYFWN